jgi:hypothetical protein
MIFYFIYIAIKYSKNYILTGKYAIADIDNDGYNEVIAAGYTIGQLYVYTYAP